MGKPETQPGRNPARFFSQRSAGQTSDTGTALEDDDSPDAGAFYRPAAKRPISDRPDLGNVPFRDKKVTPLDEGEDEPFLRSRRRVAVRRGFLPRGRWGRIGYAAGAIALLGALAWTGYAVRTFAAHDPRFRIDSSENIQILGNSEVTQPELLSVFGGDMGRNVFFIPLGERRAELERLPWVENATVMRLLPNQLRVSVVERAPVAFVRNGNTIGLVDRDGVLLSLNPKIMTDPQAMAARHYSFPVVTGIAADDPPSTRAARMKLYQRFIAEIDASGENLSKRLSEVDLSDPEDVKALVPSDGNELMLHLGDQDFLTRWRNYQQHLAEWKAQYPRLASVDLRYERQVVLEMRKGDPASSASNAAANAAGANVADTGTPKAAPSPSTLPKPKTVKAAAKAKPRFTAKTTHTQPGAR